MRTIKKRRIRAKAAFPSGFFHVFSIHFFADSLQLGFITSGGAVLLFEVILETLLVSGTTVETLLDAMVLYSIFAVLDWKGEEVNGGVRLIVDEAWMRLEELGFT
jgi:hypothetical protein